MNTLNIWNNINERLTNFVLGKTKDENLAKDIVQDVFVKVFTKANTLQDPNKLVSWIYQIARNEIANHFRNAKVKTLEQEVNTIETFNKSLTSEVAECLHPLIDTLPKKYKEALILADIEKIPQKEIAERLSISYSGAKSRVQRGREMLKSIMEEICIITTDTYGDILKYEIRECGKKKLKDFNIDFD